MKLESCDIAIVGGGASAVLLARQLVRPGEVPPRVTIIERGPVAGLGVAYATHCAEHLLNVRAHNMSALPDDPDHFVRWLSASGHDVGPEDFASRMIYGCYLQSVLATTLADGRGDVRLVRGEVVAAHEHHDGMRLALGDRRSIAARAVVMATGHEAPAVDRGAYRGNPWKAAAVEDLDPSASVMIVGTGLTMVDVVISLLDRGHRGPITAVSRRGLMPRTHPDAQDRNPDCPTSEVFAGSLSARLAAFRRLVREGHAWEDVMQALRMHNADLWKSLDPAERGRFLRHLRPWWDVHRHRIAPRIGRSIAHLVDSGRLSLLSGRIVSMRPGPASVDVTIRLRGSGILMQRSFDRVIDCSGPRSSASESSALHVQLARAGMIVTDPMQLGLVVDENDAVLTASGQPSGRIFALGPLTRGRHWEIIAVPDIRLRAKRLARHLLATVDAGATVEQLQSA
jgi:uncharacterized NAD(P)/FAD-binding protein YdhS